MLFHKQYPNISFGSVLLVTLLGLFLAPISRDSKFFAVLAILIIGMMISNSRWFQKLENQKTEHRTKISYKIKLNAPTRRRCRHNSTNRHYGRNP